MPPASPSPLWHRRLPAWAWIIIAATGAGLFFGAQIYYAALGSPQPLSWPQALYWSFRDWYEWALLSPVIFWLCRRFRFESTKWRLSVPVFALAAVFLPMVHALMCSLAAVFQCSAMGSHMEFLPYARHLLATRTPFNLAVFFLIVAAWHARDYYDRYRGRGEKLAEVEQQLAKAQLFALRMQLNPHFLFNTLNTISSLMLTDVRAANQMVSRLGALLHEILEDKHGQEIPLSRELEITMRYLEIERVRFGERLAVTVDAPPEVQSAAVPPFVLQPLIENAIRHALDRRRDGGTIGLQFARAHDALFLRVSDNGSTPGESHSRPLHQRQESIGLGNTRQRLEKLYGPRHWLRLDRNAEGGTTVEIMVPFREFATTAS